MTNMIGLVPLSSHVSGPASKDEPIKEPESLSESTNPSSKALGISPTQGSHYWMKKSQRLLEPPRYPQPITMEQAIDIMVGSDAPGWLRSDANEQIQKIEKKDRSEFATFFSDVAAAGGMTESNKGVLLFHGALQRVAIEDRDAFKIDVGNCHGSVSNFTVQHLIEMKPPSWRRQVCELARRFTSDDGDLASFLESLTNLHPDHYQSLDDCLQILCDEEMKKNGDTIYIVNELIDKGIENCKKSIDRVQENFPSFHHHTQKEFAAAVQACPFFMG